MTHMKLKRAICAEPVGVLLQQEWCFSCGDDIEEQEAECCSSCQATVCESCLMANGLCIKCANGRTDH